MSPVTRPRRGPSKITATPPHSSGERVELAQIVAADWLRHALSTRPADRARAEAAVTGLYRRLGEQAPDFVWVPSPAAARPVLLDAPHRFRPPRLRGTEAPARPADWPLVSRLANLVADLRERLDERTGTAVVWQSWYGTTAPRTMTVPEALAGGSAVRDVVDAVARHPLRTTVDDAVRAPIRAELMRTEGEAAALTWYGQHDAAWIAHYDVRARVGLAAYAHDDVAHLGLWAELARSTGWWWPGQGVCVMSERPAEIHTEPQPDALHGELRLHRDDAPAVRYADGAAVHVLHGAHVPEWVLADPTPERIHAEPNVEVRRSAIERIGWARYIVRAGLRLVGSAPDPGNPDSELQLYDVPLALWGRPTRLLLAVNGSVEPDGHRRRYGLSVPAHFDDPVAAAGWSYGLSGEHYAQLLRRT